MSFIRKSLLLVFLPFLIAIGNAEPEKKEEAFTPRQDRGKIHAKSQYAEGLPNVLIIGDSISIGYTPEVIATLRGKANIFRIPTNGRHTQQGLDSIDKWLKPRKEMEGKAWDLIHFNWGLHDLCYRNPKSKVQGKRDKVNGTQNIPIDKYEENLEKLVLRLKETKAKLIWAHTTHVPSGEVGRIQGDDLKYNAVAQKIMEKHSVPVNDLNASSLEIQKHALKAGDVHFTNAGSKLLGRKVAGEIAQSLNITLDEAQK